MKKKIWIHKARSFREAERFDQRYYQAMSPEERLETVDWLRQIARKFHKVGNGRTRLRRVIRVIHVQNLRVRKRRQRGGHASD